MKDWQKLAASTAIGLVMAFSATAGAEEMKAEGDWVLELGAGAGYAPDYEGSDDYEAMVFPSASLTWRDTLFISLDQGIGGYILNEEEYQLGMALTMTDGRDASDNDDLRGLGDVDSGAGVSVFGSYMVGPVMLSADVTKGVSGDNKGLTADLAAEMMIPSPSDRLMITAGPNITFADDEHMQTFFGVSNAQAARSVYNRHDAEGGVKSVGFGINAMYEIDEAWGAGAMLEYTHLMGDAADSPFVKEEGGVFLGLMTTYRFDW